MCGNSCESDKSTAVAGLGNTTVLAWHTAICFSRFQNRPRLSSTTLLQYHRYCGTMTLQYLLTSQCRTPIISEKIFHAKHQFIDYIPASFPVPLASTVCSPAVKINQTAKICILWPHSVEQFAMIYCQKLDSLGYMAVAASMGLASTDFTYLALKRDAFGGITQSNGHYAAHGYSR